MENSTNATAIRKIGMTSTKVYSRVSTIFLFSNCFLVILMVHIGTNNKTSIQYLKKATSMLVTDVEDEML